MAAAAAGATQLTYRGIIYAVFLWKGLDGAAGCPVCHAAGGVQPGFCFISPAAPEAQAPASVGNHQAVWRFFFFYGAFCPQKGCSPGDLTSVTHLGA